MVTFSDKQIYIDNKPVFLLSGELHYYRQPKENWQHLLDEAKSMGLNCISSYVPWIMHEEIEGNYDFTENLDLEAFIDLCKENGLYFFVRPGPYIMAEMKKEGVPYWVFEKCKSALPVSFRGATPSCNTLDYLDSAYLAECKKWYEKILQIVVPRLQGHGGNIIGVQLDNEIGMLNWVTNTPVLNKSVLSRFVATLATFYTPSVLQSRYPFDLKNPEEYVRRFREPREEYSIAFHYDFGRFLRQYYAEYALTLKEYAVGCGISDVPFFINIHGTGEGRIFDFPLGVSQLYQAINSGEGMIGGTDIYLGEPTEGKYQDLYVINTVTDAMNKKGNPLTSIEFECSDGPYCSLNGMRYHPSATSHKMLLCLSQNARMLSFYVFSGGENYLLKHPKPDGDERIAFTGEQHGMNAPIQPDGSHNSSFSCIADTAKSIHALNGLVGSAKQKLDNISLAFCPDYFLTEMTDPTSAAIKKIHENLKQFRCAEQIDRIARAFLGLQYKFDCVDIENEPITTKNILFFLCARYLSAAVQQKLVQFVTDGGKLILYGELPEFDLEGNPCTLLLNALALSAPQYTSAAHPEVYLSYRSCAEPHIPDFPGERAQVFQGDSSAIVKLYGSDFMCGFIKNLGRGEICAVTCDYPCALPFWKNILEKFGSAPYSTASCDRQGIYLSVSEGEKGQKLLYLLNLDAFEKKVDIVLHGKVLWQNYRLASKFSGILPLHVQTPVAEVVKSTGEIAEIGEQSLTIRLTQHADTLVLRCNKTPIPSNSFLIEENGEYITITSQLDARLHKYLTVNFK